MVKNDSGLGGGEGSSSDESHGGNGGNENGVFHKRNTAVRKRTDTEEMAIRVTTVSG